MRRTAFALTHKMLYRLAIPVLSRAGPLEPRLLDAYRWATHRSPRMDQFSHPLASDGFTLYYDQEIPSYTVRGIAMGTYERATVALIKAMVTPGTTVVDVGAHIGYFTLLGASLVGEGGHVWSFEPDPRNRALLERNITENDFDDRVTVVPKAIGADDHIVALHRDSADSGSSSVYNRDGQASGSVPVQMTSLDKWAESSGWPEIGLMKMDIEGAEDDALTGMGEVISRNPALSLIVEFNVEALSSAEVSSNSFLDRLRDAGFDEISVIAERGLRRLDDRPSEARLARSARWTPVNLYCRRRDTIAKG